MVLFDVGGRLSKKGLTQQVWVPKPAHFEDHKLSFWAILPDKINLVCVSPRVTLYQFDQIKPTMCFCFGEGGCCLCS